MGALGRTARRLKAGFAALFLITLAAALAPQDAQAQVTVTLTATPGPGQVTLTWTTSSPTPAGFLVTRLSHRPAGGSYQSKTLTSANSGSYTLTGLTPGTSYDFFLSNNWSGHGQVDSNTVSATPTAVTTLAAPTGLTATGAGTTQVLLTWTKPAGTITGYKLRYAKTPAKGSATWAAMAGSGANTVRHMVTGLEDDAEYSFMIRAVNASGDGAATGWVTATPMDSCPSVLSPTNLSLAPRSDGFVVTWTAPTDVFRNGWTLSYGKTGESSTSVTISNAAATSRTLTGLDANTEYEISLTATHSTYNPSAVCPPGVIVKATGTTLAAASTKTITLSATSTSITEGNTGSTDVTVTATLGEGAPADFSITLGSDITTGTAKGSNKGSDQCTAPLNPADSDWCWPNSDASVSIAAGETEGTRTLRILGDTRDEPNETIKLLGYKSGWTAGKLTLTITDDDPPTVLKPPTGLTVVPGPDRLYLSWTAPTDSNRTGWRVRHGQLGLSGTTWNDWSAISGAGTTSHTITGLSAGTSNVELQATDGSRFSTKATGSGNVRSGLFVQTQTGSILNVKEGGSKTYRINLNSRGTGPVTVTPASTNSDLSFTPASLTFSAANWIEMQNMTVSAAGDADEDDEDATITYTVSGGGYPAITNTTTVKIEDTGTSTSVTPTLAQPTNLRATAGNRQVSLTWTKPPGAITGYEVRYTKTVAAWGEWTAIPGSGASTESHTVSGLDGGSEYSFQIRAVNSAGKGVSNQVNATPTGSSTPTVAVPAAPTGLSAEAGNRQVKLTWTDPDDDSITRYRVQQRKGSAAWGSWTAISGSDADTTTHTVTGLDNDSEYRFRIRARNSGGNGAASAVVEATPSASAAVPKPVLSAEPGYARVSLSWSALSGVTVASWGYQYKPAGGSWIRTRTVTGGSTTSVTVTGLTIGTEYTFRLFAAVGPGVQSVWSDQVKATPTNKVPKPVLTAAGGDASVTLSWSGLSGIPITSWGYQYKSTGGWNTTTTVTGRSRTSVRVTGLTKGTDYTFRLFAAVSPGVQSVWSDEVTAKTDPAAPALTAATSTTNGQIDLTWTHAGGSNELSDADDYVKDAAKFHWWRAQTRLKGASAWTDRSLNQASARQNPGSRSNRLLLNYPDGASVEVRVRATGYRMAGVAGGTGNLQGPWSNIRTVTFKDDTTAALTLTGTPVTVAPGSTATYTVALTKAYAGTLRVTSDATAAARVSPASLTFTTSNYNTARTVTVTGVANGTAVINHAFRLTGASADAIPDAGTVDVTVADTPGVTVSTAALTVAEGGSKTYTMRLNTPPSSDVTITVGGTSGDVTVEPASLTFTRTDWNQPQTVTVTAGTDTDTTTDADVTLTHSASGGGYGSVSIASVVVSVAEKDVAPLKPTGLAGAAGNGSVTLSWTDPDNPTITKWQYRQKAGSDDWGEWTDISGSDATTTRYEVSGLTNGTAYQFEVRAVNGAGNGAGPDAPVSATPTAPATPAPTTPTTPPATPTAGVTVTPTALTVAEGGSGSYTVALDTQPSGDVTVTVGGASGDVTTSLASLTFTSANYNTAQTVTVMVAEDDDATTDPAVTLTHSASGGGYGSVSIDAVTVTITENDAAAVTPSAEAAVTLSASVLTIQEGSSGHYTVVLDSQPTDDVTVTIGGASGDVSVQPASLTFTRANYATAQTVTVMAAEDEDAATDPAVTLTHSASGGGYGSVSIGAVTVTITENDETAVRLSASGLTVEEGSSGHYTVVLDSPPTDEVTVTIGGASGDVSVQPDSLTFTRANYATAQTVTVTAAEDEDAATDAAVTLTHSASGGGYDAVSIDAVTVTITEDDEAGVTLSASALTIQEGNSGHYTVVLDSQPTEEVTVTLGGVAGDISVQPASLTFTSANYATAQTVTVTAATDDDAVTEPAVTLTHNASGGEYGAVRIGTVTVTIREDDEAGVTLSASSLTLQEGRSGNYTVVLDSQPTDEVTVTPGSADSSALTVMPSALRFTVANWDTAQTVTVTAARDDDTDEETVRVSHAVSGGDYDSVVAPSVTVTVTDTTAAERVGRANRVNARVLPQVAAATLSQTLTAVTERIGAVASGQPAPASLQFGALPARTLEEEWGFLPRSEPSAPSVSEMLDGATFALPLQMSGDSAAIQPSGLAAWGRGERVSLSGTEEEVSWDGDLWSAHLGADMYIRPDLLAGAALSYGEGEVDTQTTESDGSRIAGTYETTLTAIHPYVSHMLADGSHLWGSMGYGQGEARIREGSATRKTDLSQWSVALGGRRVLLEDSQRIAGGLTRIALKGEGALARLDTDAQEDLTELTVKTTRLRLLLEGSHERALQGGATVTPALEAGLRHDGGDLGSGLGLEAGASLTWRNPRAGWLAELRARSLVAHEKDRDEWGISALVRMEPAADGRGLSLTFGPEYGHTASGMESWFDYRPTLETANSAARDDMEGRLEAELGYGIGVSRTGAMALLTPYTGFSLGQSGSETFRVGARYRLGEGLSVGIEGKHQPQAVGENSLMLRAVIRW